MSYELSDRVEGTNITENATESDVGDGVVFVEFTFDEEKLPDTLERPSVSTITVEVDEENTQDSPTVTNFDINLGVSRRFQERTMSDEEIECFKRKIEELVSPQSSLPFSFVQFEFSDTGGYMEPKMYMEDLECDWEKMESFLEEFMVGIQNDKIEGCFDD